MSRQADQSSSHACANAEGSCGSAACIASSPDHSATICAIAESEVMKLLVAAALFSGPAPCGRMIDAISASGESGSLTSATTIAPESRAAPAAASKSGLRPDCDIARQSVFPSESGALNTENIEGESEDAKMPNRVSTR
jgi:hypothetical protein